MSHHKVLHTTLDFRMAHNERSERRRNVQRPEFLRWRRVAGNKIQSRARIYTVGHGTHERRMSFTRLSMGKNAILVRTLAKARINEFAPDTGDDTFSYSSAPHYQTRPTKKD